MPAVAVPSHVSREAAPVVLHVPYTYFPDAVGGTEIYVRGLAHGLAQLGYAPVIAAPARTAARYVDEGLPVHRFATDPQSRLELAYGRPDEIAAEGFGRIVADTVPSVVHLHARTAAVSQRLVTIARAAGAKVVLTYHTPTVSCARGDMMLFGEAPCDGKIARQRCVTCGLAGRGAPKALATLAGSSPIWLTKVLSRVEGAPSAARAPGLIAEQLDRVRGLLDDVDHVVAVCDWVRNVLAINGVPPHRLTLSRQGIGNAQRSGTRLPARPQTGPLRIAYFGRTDPTKGPDLLADALALIPDSEVSVDIYAVVQTTEDRRLDKLKAQAQRDSRIAVRPPVAPSDVQETMAGYDLIAVPSRWLETGPLVVLEAFAAGVPVLGAHRGGIAELVRDGVDGVLAEPSNAAAWSREIARLAAQRGEIDKLRDGISPPRTTADAAADMAALYAGLGVPSAAHVSSAGRASP